MMERIYPAAPFDFRKMLQRPLSRLSKLSVIDQGAASYVRAIQFQTRSIPVKILWSGTVEYPALDIHFPDNLKDDERQECISTVRFMFSVDRDISGFMNQFLNDPVWADNIHRFFGLRPILEASLFESMVKVIIGQQLNVRFAATLIDRLVELSGETLEWNGYLLPLFPSPERVAGWSYEQLRVLSFSQRKAEYVVDFARSVVNGQLDLNSLWLMTDHEIIESLTKIRGIGRWTVECFLLFGMGRTDVIPAADIGVQNAVKALYDLPERPNEAELRDMALAWTPWRSYAAYYLWNSLIKPGSPFSRAI